MASKTPEIQADALLNLVLDEKQLKTQLQAALGTSIAEAAKNANLGDKLLSPKNLQQMRRNLQQTFQSAGKDIAEGLNLAQSQGLQSLLEKTRRDTVKKFQRDINDLMTGKGRTATRSLQSLPTLGADELKDLRSALKVFGQDALRSGSYQQRGNELMQAQRNIADLNKVFTELAGIPAVAAKDLQKIRSLVNDKDTTRYLQMQQKERANLVKSGQALELQTQSLGKLANTLSKMGFGDIATDIKAANQARKSLISDFNRLSSPAAVESRARQELVAQQRADQQQAARDRRALQQAVRQREQEQKAQGTYQTIFGARRAGQVSPGLAATMDNATRARLGLPSREEMRAASLKTMAPTAEERRLNAWFNDYQSRASGGPLEQAQQNIARAAADRAARRQREQEQALARLDQQMRDNEANQLKIRDAYLKGQEKLNQQSLADQAKANENQQRQREKFIRSTASAQDASRIIRGVGGIGNLRDSLDIATVRGGLTASYRAAQVRLNQANVLHGADSTQYNQALAELNAIRGQRDQLASRIREIRAQGAGGTGGGAAGAGGGRDGGWSPGNLLRTFSNYAIGYGSLYQVLNAVTKLKDEIIELDRAFYSIKAVTQATDVEMQSISRSIKEVALNTNFTTREIASAAEVLGQAGVAPADMDKVLSATAKFASATNSSLQVAADLMTTVRTVFKTLDEGTIADQLTRAVNLSKLTAEDLQTILSLTSQTAASYNVNLEQLLAGVTTLRNAGIKPSTVATGLRQAMLEIFNPDTATMKALMTRYGQMGGRDAQLSKEQIQQRFFGFTNADNPFLAALTELKRIGFTDEGQKVLQRGVDIRAFNAIQGLLQNYKELEEAESKITFGKAAAEGAEIQMKSLSASLENLGASVVVLAEQMSNGLVRQLAAGASGATDLIEKLSQLDLQMKATGEGSLNQVLAGIVTGGLAGAASGKGFKGKAIGAAIGATAGGYLGGGYKFDEGEGFGVGDAAGIAATLLLIGRFVKWIGGITKAVAPIASTLKGGALVGAAAGTASVGLRFVPVLNWILLAVTALDAIADVLPEDQAKKLAAQAEAASAQAAKVRENLGKNTELVKAFDPNAKNPEPGTASAGFAKYRDSVENFNLALSDTFGEMTEAQAKNITDQLKQYSSLTYSQRTSSGIREAIGKELGKPLDDAIDDHVLFSLGKQREEIEATVSAYVQNTQQLITGVTERIRAARAAGDKISEKDAAFSQAFSENFDELQQIVDGTSGKTPEQTIETLRQFYARFTELVDERPALEAEERSKSMQALANELAAALANSNNSAEIAQAVSQIGNSLEFISLSTADRLGSILAGLEKAKQQVDSELASMTGPGSVFLGKEPSLALRATNWLWRAAGSPDEQGEAQVNAYDQRRSQLEAQQKALAAAQDKAVADDYRAGMAQLQANKAAREKQEQDAKALLSGFAQPDIAAALGNRQTLVDIGLKPNQIQQLMGQREALTGNNPDVLERLSATTKDAKGNTVPTEDFKQLSTSFNLIAANLAKVTEAQQRAARDQGNLVTVDMLKQKTGAETAIKQADYGKNYALLAKDSPDNPVVQLFDAQKQILEKELAQAKAKAADAKDDGSKTAVAREQAVLEAQAKLDTLGMEKQQELAKYAAKLKTQGEQQQKKADAEARKQAHIDVTQTGIEQRTVKQNFDEAIRTGDVGQFTELSNKYIEVQGKLRDQLENELKARGYNAEQILAEIKLRQDLNKPLAEQVENIRKLAEQRRQQRDLDFRDVGSGPALGSKFNTAYLGVDGFTTAEQAAAATRDIVGLLQRRSLAQADMNDAVFKRDKKTVDTLQKEIDDIDTQLGTTQAQLDKMTRGGADSIYAAFSPRDLVIELEKSQNTFANLGDNLRSTLGSAINDIGQGLAQAYNNGEKLSDVLQQIINQAATQALGDLLSTNINEGVKGLIKGATGDEKTGAGGGLGGIWDSITSGFGNFFGFGGDKKATGKGGTADSGGGVGGFLSGLFGLGQQGGAAGALGAASSVATMNVTAGTVTVMGGAGMPGLDGLGGSTPGAGTGAAASGQGVLSSGTPGAGSAIGASGGSVMGALGGAGIGIGLGAALGGAIGGKKGSKWGAILGGLAGAYFGFGMAGGGRITKSGMVVGSGARGVDSVPVSVRGTGQHGLLAPGEGVLNVKAMDALGSGWLNAANSGKLFRKAVGGIIGQSYNATERAEAAAARSVAQSSNGGGNQPITVQLKNVNVMDQSEVYSALQKREGEDVMINRLQRRGALNNSKR